MNKSSRNKNICCLHLLCRKKCFKHTVLSEQELLLLTAWFWLWLETYLYAGRDCLVCQRSGRKYCRCLWKRKRKCLDVEVTHTCSDNLHYRQQSSQNLTQGGKNKVWGNQQRVRNETNAFYFVGILTQTRPHNNTESILTVHMFFFLLLWIFMWCNNFYSHARIFWRSAVFWAAEFINYTLALDSFF